MLVRHLRSRCANRPISAVPWQTVIFPQIQDVRNGASHGGQGRCNREKRRRASHGCARQSFPTDVRNGASHSGGVHRGAQSTTRDESRRVISTTRDESRRVILLSTAMAFIGERKARSCFSGFPNFRGVQVGSLPNPLTCVFVGFVGLGCFIAVLRRCSAGYSRWIFDGNGLLFVVFGRRKRLAWMEICRTYV